ncbi:MAG: hypothetical protein KJ747_06475 [Actinobacteria bacterium]|nr:hypothetical protein [Actinomycetota bacterium]MCG2807921.1 hypothetical protein [Coriobacteriia bacterium]
MQLGGRHISRIRIAVVAVSLLTGIMLATGADLATGAQVTASATVRQSCSVSVNEGQATVRSNLRWELVVIDSDGASRLIQGGPTNGQTVELESGDRVELITQ